MSNHLTHLLTHTAFKQVAPLKSDYVPVCLKALGEIRKWLLKHRTNHRATIWFLFLPLYFHSVFASRSFHFLPRLTWLMTLPQRRSWFASQSVSTSSPQRERDKCLHKTEGSAFIRPEWQQVCHFFFFCNSISIAFIVLFILF